jgi:hypothetical protein
MIGLNSAAKAFHRLLQPVTVVCAMRDWIVAGGGLVMDVLALCAACSNE